MIIISIDLVAIFRDVLENFKKEKPSKDSSFVNRIKNVHNNDLKRLVEDITDKNQEYDVEFDPGIVGKWSNPPKINIIKINDLGESDEFLFVEYIFKPGGDSLNLSLKLKKSKNDSENLQNKIVNKLIRSIDFEIPKGFFKDNSNVIIYKNYSEKDLDTKVLIDDLKEIIKFYEKIIPYYKKIIKENESLSLEKALLMEDRNIWSIAPGNRKISKKVWELFKKDGYVAIGWFGSNDDRVSYKDFKSKDEIREKLHKSNKSHVPKMIWDFTNSINMGDIVIANKGKSTVAGIGVVTSDYISPKESDIINEYELVHIRKVKWLITDEFEVGSHFFNIKTLTKLKTNKWNIILEKYASNNEEFRNKLINYLFNNFKEDYFDKEEGKNHFHQYNLLSNKMKDNFSNIVDRWENDEYIADDVWNDLISPKGIFSVYSDSRLFFKKNYNLSDEDLDKTAILFFNTVYKIVKFDADFRLHENVLSDFVNNDYSKGFKSALLSLSLYLLDNDFYLINKKTIDSVELLSGILGVSVTINSNLLEYVENNKKLHEFLIDLSDFVEELADFRVFDEFTHWLCSSGLGAYARSRPLPLVGFEIDISLEKEKDLKLELIPDLIDLGDLKVQNDLLFKICASLNAGKNIILDGTPGTGKTELALAVSSSTVDNLFISDYILTTATSDWTTFDTIGGFMPNKNGELEFREGQFLKAIRQNSWLIIDEINRADIDKAFGQLFTVLSGQEVELPYEINGNRIKISPSEEEKSYFDENTSTYYVGKNWRIIATMNVYDKDSLFDMSYAFMRRFSFITVDIPNNEDYADLIDLWCEDIDQSYCDNLKILLNLNEYRKLGPAIFKDMINYIVERTNLDDSNDVTSEVILSYILPQFEGLESYKLKKLLSFFEEHGFYSKEIKNKLEEYNGMDL